MKWFKHYSNAHKGNVLQEIYLRFGVNEGHGLYFRLLEYLADKWDGHSEPRFRILTSELRGYCKLTAPRFHQLAAAVTSSGESKFKIGDDFCEIYIPKLLEIRHRDALNAGARQASCQHKSGGEENRIEENRVLGVRVAHDPHQTPDVGSLDPTVKVRVKKGEPEGGAKIHIFATTWNEVVVSLPKVRETGDARRRAINAFLKTKTQDDWLTLCRKVQKSNFLSGRNGEWTACGFDWCLKPANAVKVLEGNYDNPPDSKTAHKSSTTGYADVSGH